ncbi:MAG: hypothetical protein EPO32_09755 [Anaerolineae bacterium]|nr:MAG: hypothetical protein EPO32_09755 [Anaerolineae bacterium]
MNTGNVLLGAGLAFLAAGLYGFVGLRMGRRVFENPEERLAWNAFRTWWLALAAVTALGALPSVAAVLGVRELWLFLSFTIFNLFGTCLALWGLLYYLVFLFTGNRRTLWPLAGFYLLFFFGLLAYIFYSGPAGLEERAFSVAIRYERPISGIYLILVLLFLVLPQIIASLAYFRLFFRVREPDLRYRIAVVSWAIIMWFGLGLLAPLVGLSRLEWWPLASRGIGLLAALAIYFAYFPPIAVQRRLDATITN